MISVLKDIYPSLSAVIEDLEKQAQSLAGFQTYLTSCANDIGKVDKKQAKKLLATAKQFNKNFMLLNDIAKDLGGLSKEISIDTVLR